MCFAVYKIIKLLEDNILEWNCILQTHYFLNFTLAARRPCLVAVSGGSCLWSAGSSLVTTLPAWLCVPRCPVACDLPGPGVKPMSSLLTGGFLTT